jgi:hypothetical protein
MAEIMIFMPNKKKLKMKRCKTIFIKERALKKAKEKERETLERKQNLMQEEKGSRKNRVWREL